MCDTADAKVLELDQCTGKSFTSSSQVGCYKLAMKEYIDSNSKTKKNHSGGF